MPNWCENDLRISSPDVAWLDGLEKAIEENKMLSYIRPNPTGEWEYGWSVENWGTKWDVGVQFCERQSDTEIFISFDSAWAPPLLAYEYLLDQMSDNQEFALEAHYFEPGVGFVGYYDNGVDECYDVDPEDLEQIPEWLREYYNIDEWYADMIEDEDEELGENDDQA